MKQTIIGVDVYLVHEGLPKIDTTDTFQLSTILNRGTKVFPGPKPTCHLTDVHQCRFEAKDDVQLNLTHVKTLLEQLEKQGFHWCEVHNVYQF